MSDVWRSLAAASSLRWGRFRAVQMILCQCGVPAGCLRGEDGGVGAGEVEMSVQCFSLASCLARVRRGFGGLEFHFLVRILLRIAREESPPLVASFIRYIVSFVLPFSDHGWRFLPGTILIRILLRPSGCHSRCTSPREGLLGGLVRVRLCVGILW